MHQERDDFAITYYAKENQIFVFGGYDGKDVLNQCEKYSISLFSLNNQEYTIKPVFNQVNKL